MIHADNQGLVLPPRIADIQIVIVACGITVNMKEEDKKNLLEACDTLESELKTAGVRTYCDHRDNYSPGWKFNHWELKVRDECFKKNLFYACIIIGSTNPG